MSHIDLRAILAYNMTMADMREPNLSVYSYWMLAHPVPWPIIPTVRPPCQRQGGLFYAVDPAKNRV